MTRALAIAVLSISLEASASPAQAAPILFGPTPYLSSADIPVGFFSGPFLLENFEDNSLDFGITASGSGTSILGPSIVTDSVDADDGVIDGSGLNGHSFLADGNPGVTFTFSGPLPTAAALVWTDGASFDFVANDDVTFQAFGPGMASLGVWTFTFAVPDTYAGQTAEDRFLGVQDPGGILALRVVNPSGQLETDHVMFGTAGSNEAVVPEPTTLTLVGLGALMGMARRRRVRR